MTTPTISYSGVITDDGFEIHIIINEDAPGLTFSVKHVRLCPSDQTLQQAKHQTLHSLKACIDRLSKDIQALLQPQS